MSRSRPSVTVEVVESGKSLTLTAGTPAGLFVYKADKSTSLVALFDEAHVAIAAFLGMPVNSFDVRFSLQQLTRNDTNAKSDESPA